MPNPLESDGSWDTHTEAINAWLFEDDHEWDTLIAPHDLVFVGNDGPHDMGIDISKDTITVAGRAMRVLLMHDLSRGTTWRQPFYQSSGHNSGMPGTWLPFFGLSVSRVQDGMMRGWFRKYYVAPDKQALVPTCSGRMIEYECFGCAEMHILSEAIVAYQQRARS